MSHETDLTGRAARGERLRPELAIQIAEGLVDDEDLEPTDRFMLIVEALQRIAEKRVLADNEKPNTMIPKRRFSRTLLLAIDATVRATARSSTKWFPSMRRACRTFTAWGVWIEDLLDRHQELEKLSKRQQACLAHWSTIRSTFGVRRDFGQFSQAALRAARQLEWSMSPDEVVEFLGEYKKISLGTDSGLYISGSGTLHLSSRQLRERIASAYGLSRKRSAKQRGVKAGSPSKPFALGEHVSTGLPSMVTALEALAAAESLRALRVVAEERSQAAKPGSLRRIALDHLAAQLRGDDQSIRQTAADCGVDHSALAREVRSQRDWVQREAGILQE